MLGWNFYDFLWEKVIGPDSGIDPLGFIIIDICIQSRIVGKTTNAIVRNLKTPSNRKTITTPPPLVPTLSENGREDCSRELMTYHSNPNLIL